MGIPATVDLKGVQPAALHCPLLNCLAHAALGMTLNLVQARVPQACFLDARPCLDTSDMHLHQKAPVHCCRCWRGIELL